MDGHLTKVINQKTRLVQISPTQSEAWESQTSYPKVQWENTPDKRELQKGSAGEDEMREILKKQSGDHGEHRVILAKVE